jgi:hypothetical protein
MEISLGDVFLFFLIVLVFTYSFWDTIFTN